MAQELTARVAHIPNPLHGIAQHDLHAVEPGRPIASYAPADPKGLLVCQLNGGPDYLARASWGEPLAAGDVLVFIEYPQDRDTLRGALQIAIAVAAIASGNPYYAVAITVGGNLALNALLPPTQPLEGANPETPKTVYSTSLGGNLAKAFDPIPKIVGRHLIFPPFAAQPYTEFGADGEQYYYALFAVDIGNPRLERSLIDDTDITHFQDVLTNRYLAPGEQPTTVGANVVTSPEVAGQTMDTAFYIGGFAACAPRLVTGTLGIDVVAPRGLGTQNGDGSISAYSVSWRVEVRPINEFGVPTGPWAILATEDRTAATSTPQRWTVTYSLGSPAFRPEVRIVRTDIQDTSIYALNELQWTGMRAYLTGAATLDSETAHYELVLRASKQLSSLAQGRFAVIANAKCATLDIDLARLPPSEHRNPAWWALECATSSVWGLGLPDDRVDLQSFYDLAQTCDTRQDRVDYVFDASTSAWDALQLIARCARSRVFRRGAILSIARDELATLGVTAFMPRNVRPGSMTLSERLPQREDADGVVVEYYDYRRWGYQTIDCPAPGVVSMAAPTRMRLAGITGPTQARREGLYEAAVAYYRTRDVSAVAEMQGLIPAYMSAVRWMTDAIDAGQSGDVVTYDAASRALALSEPPDWSQGDLYISFVADDGSLTPPQYVTPGDDVLTAVLSADPAATLSFSDVTRERTKYLIAPLAADGDLLVKVTALKAGGVTSRGSPLYRVECTVDDPRVHAVDLALLPGPGEVQDPVDESEGTGGGGGELLIVTLPNTLSIFRVGPVGPVTATLNFRNDGTFDGLTDGASLPFTDSWLYNHPVETSIAGLFEIRVTVTGRLPFDAVFSAGVEDTWQSLDVDRGWAYTNDFPVDGLDTEAIYFTVEIREISTAIIQDTCRVDMNALVRDDSGGGGD